MPHKTINSYPSIGAEQNLPIFMRAVGCYEHQPFDKKEDGYLYHQLFFVEEGELELSTGGNVYHLKKDMGFFLHKEVPYQIKKITNLCTTHWVSFGCLDETAIFPLIQFDPVMIFPKLNTKSLQMQLKKMYLLSTEDTFYSRCQNSALVYTYLMDIYTQNEQHAKQLENEIDNPALLLAKRYIEQYYFNELTLDTIADFAHVSPQHLCRLFQKHMQMRPTHYINLTRIKVSKWLLHNSDKSVTEIAEEVGYHSPYYFTNTFKKYENMSPSAYRKMVQS